jgi:acyl-CoA thioester hydrolase
VVEERSSRDASPEGAALEGAALEAASPGPGPVPLQDPGLPSRRSAFPVRWAMPTRWADNDHYGHVNNVTYYSYFDTAVNGYLMEATGGDIRELEAVGLVVETACRFLAPVSFPDHLEVGLAVSRLGRSSITYHIGLFRAGEEEPVALARFVHVYVDRTNRRTTTVPEVIRAAVGPLLSPEVAAGG